MKRNELKAALEKLNLPDPKPISDNPTPAYEKVLRDLGVTTVDEINTLRELVGEKIEEMSFKVQMKAFKDFTAGKYSSIEEVPLYRDESGDRVVVRNIPEEMMTWLSFIAWLNERVEVVC